MRIIRAKDYNDMSRKAAGIIGAQVVLEPASVLGLATGSSPLGVYKQLIEWYKKGDLDFSQATTINLDEYVGLAAGDVQSYRYFMNHNLLDHINILKENTHVPNGMNPDEAAESASYEGIIRAAGGIDLQLLGMGHNGHIGFNEPGTVFEKDTHKVALTESTIDANKRFFEKESDVPRHAYTMGIRSIMQAKRILIIVSGGHKAQILRDALCGPVTPAIPASVLQLHTNVTLVGDKDALSLI